MRSDSYYDPPDEPSLSPESEAIAERLEAAGCDQALIDEVTTLIESLQAQAQRECPVCEKRAYEKECATNKAAAEYWDTLQPEQYLCPHGQQLHECNPCLVAGDEAYDAARERKFR